MNKNKLIAKFMGYITDDTLLDNFDETYPVHKDWNLLFTVLEKIESLGYHPTISKRQFQVYSSNWKMIIDSDFYDSFLENAYHGVNAFIKFYNEKNGSI